MKRDLIYNDEKHEYFLDGIKIPSVTQILQHVRLIDFSNVPAIYLERARKFGKAVHKGTELYDKGTLNWNKLSDPLKPYVNAWIKFKEENKIKIFRREEPACSYKYGYGLTPDGIFDINDTGWSVIDIKTTFELDDSVAWQTSAYRQGGAEYYGIKIPHRHAIHLKKDETYKLTPLKDKGDFRTFQCALHCFNAKRR
ncbi:hypothetical protein LCGC14_1060980 [marine sediment metagenome]|uniref:PD-(D/E)XK endonuclease-like domain-containing protein n=1 Tax=marine sediment metagenome TaxID=412755 RepID=A0A0F9N850_9ZZZZ